VRPLKHKAPIRFERRLSQGTAWGVGGGPKKGFLRCVASIYCMTAIFNRPVWRRSQMTLLTHFSPLDTRAHVFFKTAQIEVVIYAEQEVNSETRAP